MKQIVIEYILDFYENLNSSKLSLRQKDRIFELFVEKLYKESISTWAYKRKSRLPEGYDILILDNFYPDHPENEYYYYCIGII